MPFSNNAITVAAVADAMVDGPPHVVQRHREVARKACHQRVGIAQRHHAGGEHVAVLIGHALAIAQQEAITLQPVVQIVGIVGVALRQARIEDFHILMQLKPISAQHFLNLLFAADQRSAAEAE